MKKTKCKSKPISCTIVEILEAIISFISDHWLFCLVLTLSVLSYNAAFTFIYSDIDKLVKRGTLIALVSDIAITLFLFLWTGILLGRFSLLKKYMPTRNKLRWIFTLLADEFMPESFFGGIVIASIAANVFSGVFTGLWWWSIWVAVGDVPTGLGWWLMLVVNAVWGFVMMNMQIATDNLFNSFDSASSDERNENEDDYESEDDEFICTLSVEEDDIFEGDPPKISMSERIDNFMVNANIFLKRFRITVVSFLEEVMED